jgi:hypothetical protein
MQKGNFKQDIQRKEGYRSSKLYPMRKDITISVKKQICNDALESVLLRGCEVWQIGKRMNRRSWPLKWITGGEQRWSPV